MLKRYQPMAALNHLILVGKIELIFEVEVNNGNAFHSKIH
jgi:hypothetical protein